MKNPIRCLLVDDDIDDREIFQMVLSELGDHIRCNTACNGVEALRLLESPENERPDFIFLDVNMPKMNGLECLERIRRSEQFEHYKIFMYSTTIDPVVVQKSKQLQAGYIVKPVSVLTLRDTLQTILND